MLTFSLRFSPLKQVAAKLRSTRDHGAVHKASEQILNLQENSKGAGSSVKNLVKFPWVGKCVNKIILKLKNIFPKGTHEDKVVLPVYFDNKPMPGEKAACTILWKNKSVEAYRQDRRDTTDKNSGFSVSIFTNFYSGIESKIFLKN